MIINGVLTWRQSPQGTLCTLESLKTYPGISPPDGPIPTGPKGFEAPLPAPAACEKWARQLQRGRRQSASKSKSCEKFCKSSKWAGLICVLGIYRGDYLQRAHKRASMETGGTCVSGAALRYRRSVRPCGIVRGRVRVCEGEMTYSPKRRFWAYLSDPRCLPRSETSESTVVTVLARSKTRTKVSWAIRPLGKILDRQVSSPRPEERDSRSAGLFPTARRKRSSIGRSLSHDPRKEDLRSAGHFPKARGKRSSIGRSLSHGPSQRSSIGDSAAHPTGFDRGIPSHTRPVLTRWIESRTSNPTGQRSGLETTWPTGTDSATRVQKATASDSATGVQSRRSGTRRLGCDGRTL